MSKPHIIHFDRPSVVLGTNAETKDHWATLRSECYIDTGGPRGVGTAPICY